MVVYLFSRGGSARERDAYVTMEEYRSHVPATILLFAVVIGTMITFYRVWNGWWLFLPAILVGCMLVFLLVPIALISVSVLLVLALGGLDVLLIEPVAWVLEREAIDKWIKILSLLLLMVGTHFDMLAA